MRRNFLLLACGVAALAAGWAVAADKGAPAAKAPAPAGPALSVEHARREVRMLDDLYKTAIVYMNDVYVEDANSVAAGQTARDIFAAMKAKGWHDARLVDATGKPVNDENVPQNAFEKAAVKKILGGETYFDEVVKEDGRSYLRAATLVPAVNEKCVLCHPGNKVGDVLGLVSYKIPLE